VNFWETLNITEEVTQNIKDGLDIGVANETRKGGLAESPLSPGRNSSNQSISFTGKRSSDGRDVKN